MLKTSSHVTSIGELADTLGVQSWRIAPILRSDGTVLQTPGYDPDTGLYYEPDGAIIEVPASPTRDDALAATEVLLEVIADFPFATPAHQTAWLSFLLTPLAWRDDE